MWPLPPKSFAIIGRSSSRESEFVVNGSSWWRVSSSSHTPSMMAIGSGRRTLKDSQPREPISLGASFIRQEGRSVADKPKPKK